MKKIAFVLAAAGLMSVSACNGDKPPINTPGSGGGDTPGNDGCGSNPREGTGLCPDQVIPNR